MFEFLINYALYYTAFFKGIFLKDHKVKSYTFGDETMILPLCDCKSSLENHANDWYPLYEYKVMVYRYSISVSHKNQAP